MIRDECVCNIDGNLVRNVDGYWIRRCQESWINHGIGGARLEFGRRIKFTATPKNCQAEEKNRADTPEMVKTSRIHSL